MAESNLSPSEESFLDTMTRTLSLGAGPAADEPLQFEESLSRRLAAFRQLLRSLPATPLEPSLLFFDPVNGEAQAAPVGNRLVVGRTVTDGLALARPTLSGTHFSITCEGDDYILRDPALPAGKPSTTGTFVNGANARITGDTILESCDQIHAGNLQFVFTRGDDARPDEDC